MESDHDDDRYRRSTGSVIGLQKVSRFELVRQRAGRDTYEIFARLASSTFRISFALASTMAFLDSGITTMPVSSAKMISPELTSTWPTMTGSLIEVVLRSHWLLTGVSPRTNVGNPEERISGPSRVAPSTMAPATPFCLQA